MPVPRYCSAIVLARLDYGEADRIITVLTKDAGKIRVMAKGVRKERSKLAAGVELFSETSLGLIEGRGDLYSLAGTQLITHFGLLLKDYERSQAGFEMLQLINKATHDGTGQEFYTMLLMAFESLNNASIEPLLVGCWYEMRVLELLGHGLNLQTTADGTPLRGDGRYRLSFEDMAFFEHPEGEFSGDHIKVLRMLLRYTPEAIGKVSGAQACLPEITTLLRAALQISLGT